MGILNSTRKIMKKTIEKSYCMGQLHGEKKKISDSKRQNLIKKVCFTELEKTKIDNLFIENYGKKIKYDWHRLYQSFTGKFDENYFPEFLFSSKLEPKMNDADYRYVLDDKLLLPLFCEGIENVRVPRTFLTIYNDIWFDENKNLVSKQQVQNFQGGGTDAEVIIKPVQDTSSGIGVEKVCGIKNIKDRILNEQGVVVVQECIKQHEKLSILYPNAVNTFRVITYLWNGKVYHVPLALRIGQGGGYLDNAHAGGMFIGVSDAGKLNSVAFTEFGDRYEKHPDTKIEFKNYEIDFVPEIIKTAEKLHLSTPQLGIISWDITVDEHKMMVLIEANTRGQSIWFPQMANGKGAFGENTKEILQFISPKQ